MSFSITTDALVAANNHIKAMRENARESKAVEQKIDSLRSDIAQLREQRGASADPQPLSREILKRTNELDASLDRLGYLRKQAADFRAAADRHLAALEPEHEAAVAAAAADFRIRFTAAASVLRGLVIEGLALGAAGAYLTRDACMGVVIPDPEQGFFSAVLGTPALVVGERLAREASEGIPPELQASIAAIAVKRTAMEQLRSVVIQTAAEERLRVEAADADRRAARPLFNSGQLGGMQAPEPKPSGLFPRTEFTGSTMFPGDAEREHRGGAHMNPGVGVDEEQSLSKSLGVSV